MNKIGSLCLQACRARGFLFQKEATRHSRFALPENGFLSSTNVKHCGSLPKEDPPLTPEEEKKLKVLKLEYDVFQSTGIRVPSDVKDSEWIKVLKCKSVSSRKDYYNFLFCKEKATMNRKEKAAQNVKAQEEKRAEVNKLIEAGLTEKFKNRFMLMLIEATTNMFHYHNIFWGMTNGAPTLVFDFSFEEHMKEREIKDLVKQILQCHGTNKLLREPFHIHFCNISPETKTYELINRTLKFDSAPITVSQGSYLDHYPKERLVYLTPNTNNVLESFNHDDVYIIGSLVDKSVEIPLTLAKAKREGIRMARLPIDRHIKWVQGSKALPLNHVFDVLQAAKSNMPWAEAFTRSLPKRKFRDITEEDLKESQKRRTSERKHYGRPRKSFKQ